MKIRKLRL